MHLSPTNSLLQSFVESPDNPCFVCGPTNPHGLRVHFDFADDAVTAHFKPESWHEGWQGVIHGGILAALLDEAMAYTLFSRGWMAVTARMELRYRRAAHAGDDLRVHAVLTRDAPKLVEVDGTIMRNSELLVEASGRFMKLGPIVQQLPPAGAQTDTS